jgi:putative PIN family toxin of toxin-antitoxin system
MRCAKRVAAGGNRPHEAGGRYERVVSAFLWQCTPGRLLEMASEKQVRLFASRALLDELADVLGGKKLAKSVAATGVSVPQMLAAYREMITLVRAQQLPQRVSPDADDDAALAAAQAVALVEVE